MTAKRILTGMLVLSVILVSSLLFGIGEKVEKTEKASPVIKRQNIAVLTGLSEAVAGMKGFVIDTNMDVNISSDKAQYILSDKDVVQSMKERFQKYDIIIITKDDAKASRRNGDIWTSSLRKPHLNVSLEGFKLLNDQSYDACISLSLRQTEMSGLNRFDLTGISPEVDRLRERAQAASNQFESLTKQQKLESLSDGKHTVREIVTQLDSKVDGGSEAFQKKLSADEELRIAEQKLMDDIINGMSLKKSIQSMTWADEIIWKRQVRLLGPLDDFKRAGQEAINKLADIFVEAELSTLIQSNTNTAKLY